MLQILASKSNLLTDTRSDDDKPKSSLGLTYRPDQSFSIGLVDPPVQGRQRQGATEIREDKYWDGSESVEYHTVVTDHVAIERQLASRHPGHLSDELRAQLFNTYEEAGRYNKAIALAEVAASIQPPNEDESVASALPQPLGLSVVVNSHKSQSRNKRGHSGITTYGKRMVRSCGAVLEKSVDRQCLSLFTWTLPPLPEHERLHVSQHWGDINRKIWQEVKRDLVRAGLPGDHVFVTEIQEKRFQKYGEVNLHGHGLFQGKASRRDNWAISKSKIAEIVGRILTNELGRPVDVSAATRVEVPRKSLVKELGKYLTKGCKIIAEVMEAGKGEFLPSAWWGASRDLKNQVKAQTRRYRDGFAGFVIKNLERFRTDKLLIYMYITKTLFDKRSGVSRNINIGIVGYFTSEEAFNRIRREFEYGKIMQLAA